MTTPYNFDQWSNPSKFGLEPLIELNSITTHTCGEILNENLSAINDLVQTSASMMQDLSRVKGLDDAFAATARSTSQLAPRMYEHNQRILNTFLEGSQEYQKWLGKGYHQAMKEGKNMQEKVTGQCQQSHQHKKSV